MVHRVCGYTAGDAGKNVQKLFVSGTKSESCQPNLCSGLISVKDQYLILPSSNRAD